MTLWDDTKPQFLAGRGAAKSTGISMALMLLVGRVEKDNKLLSETADEELPLLINRIWAVPRTEREYHQRLQKVVIKDD